MTQISKPGYLAQARKLSKDESERLFSRMTGKLPRRLQKEKLSKLEALAIQLELEDEKLQEWRKNMRDMRDKEKAKAAKKADDAKMQAKAKKEAEKKEAKAKKEAARATAKAAKEKARAREKAAQQKAKAGKAAARRPAAKTATAKKPAAAAPDPAPAASKPSGS